MEGSHRKACTRPTSPKRHRRLLGGVHRTRVLTGYTTSPQRLRELGAGVCHHRVTSLPDDVLSRPALGRIELLEHAPVVAQARRPESARAGGRPRRRSTALVDQQAREAPRRSRGRVSARAGRPLSGAGRKIRSRQLSQSLAGATARRQGDGKTSRWPLRGAQPADAAGTPRGRGRAGRAAACVRSTTGRRGASSRGTVIVRSAGSAPTSAAAPRTPAAARCRRARSRASRPCQARQDRVALGDLAGRGGRERSPGSSSCARSSST
jgi:hypothetical protein